MQQWGRRPRHTSENKLHPLGNSRRICLPRINDTKLRFAHPENEQKIQLACSAFWRNFIIFKSECHYTIKRKRNYCILPVLIWRWWWWYIYNDALVRWIQIVINSMQKEKLLLLVTWFNYFSQLWKDKNKFPFENLTRSEFIFTATYCCLITSRYLGYLTYSFTHWRDTWKYSSFWPVKQQEGNINFHRLRFVLYFRIVSNCGRHPYCGERLSSISVITKFNLSLDYWFGLCLIRIHLTISVKHDMFHYHISWSHCMVKPVMYNKSLCFLSHSEIIEITHQQSELKERIHRLLSFSLVSLKDLPVMK